MTVKHEHFGFQRTFKENKLTLGLSMPFDTENLVNFSLAKEIELAKKAEDIGFASLFIRDIPLVKQDVKYTSIGIDPFLFLTYVSACTSKIALGTASVVTTLRHPVHTAKAAASLDLLSNERFLFGIATGDRDFEFPIFKINENELTTHFQDSISTIRTLWSEHSPKVSNSLLELEGAGLQVLPKHKNIPTFATGYSRQTFDYLKEHFDGWLFYPQPLPIQKELANKWHEGNTTFKPFMQPLMINLSTNPNEMGKPIDGGFRTGRHFLLDYLKACEVNNINHIMIHFDTSERPLEDIFNEMEIYILPHFKPHL